MGATINDVTNNSFASFAAIVDGYSANLAALHLQPTAGSPGQDAQSLRSALEAGELLGVHAPPGLGVRVNQYG